MTTYAPGPIKDVQVMEGFILEDWPDKQEGDVASFMVRCTAMGSTRLSPGFVLTFRMPFP